MAKKHRLFKVARELNTGSSTLVDFLNGRGFEVENRPNASLSEEQYGMLLKEFASAKELKKKAQQIQEKKREERLNKNNTEEPQVEEAEEILSAADLKKGILSSKNKPRKLRSMPKPGDKKPAVERQSPPPIDTTPPPAKEETPPPPKEEAPTVTTPAAEEDSSTSVSFVSTPPRIPERNMRKKTAIKAPGKTK